MDDLEAVAVGDADLFSIPTAAGPIPVAVDREGMIYLSVDLHPAGPGVALALLEKEGVRWIAAGAVDVLAPITWLAAAAMGAKDNARIVIIGRLERYIRGRG